MRWPATVTVTSAGVTDEVSPRIGLPDVVENSASGFSRLFHTE